jgi:hypothetical protein
MIRIPLDLNSVDSYRLFLRIKGLPSFRFVGREALVPDEYADRLGIGIQDGSPPAEYSPWPGMFDYQRDITRLAVRREKFAIFADCGLGKSFMFLDYARHVEQLLPPGQCVLIISPLMVIKQTIAEAQRFYGDDLPIEQVRAADLPGWLTDTGRVRIGITNYDAISDSTPKGRIGALILDESSMLKSAYGKWGQACIRMGEGVRWKLALTGTPAPNDRIEFANHAVFLDAFPNVNSFLARFFVNKGQTENRWEMKPHAIGPFYTALSHWCIFLANPGRYGWRDNASPLPPIHVHIHDVELSAEQDDAARGISGTLFPMNPGGITTRTKLARIAKGNHEGREIEAYKPRFIRSLVDSWPDESTIVWVYHNDEQEMMERTFPEAASLKGATPQDERERIIADFQAGHQRVVISKPKLMGLGLNLQIATRQVFNGLRDSFEEYYQCIKRSNRYGSTRDLNVHVPVTELDRPMLNSVLRKAHRVQEDTDEQERIFMESGYASLRD